MLAWPSHNDTFRMSPVASRVWAAQLWRLFRFRNNRHAYATGLLEAGVALPVIQRHLGHNSIRSTMRYLHLAQDNTSATPSPLDLLEFPSTAPA